MSKDKKIRVRFAPSPTGHLHIGGARTALFNYLFARHHNGVFILRIEDTDRSRSTEEYIEAIIEGMKWLKLDWDEGPYRQTDRFDIYRSYIKRLLEEGKAYRCYCTSEELEQRRQESISQGKTPKYDGRCRNIREPIPDKPYAVRFKMPEEGQTVVNDMIKGIVEFDNDQLEDLIIMRSDGTPTYNFVVVVDDIDMEITHIIRGDDHLNNTPKQIHIYKAFNWEPPQFGHLPMILGADKARLSKRHGATSVMAYKDMGYLPDALVNYLVRLGWSYGDQEIFTRDELIKYFSLENIGKSAAVFNPEKLLWLNSQYIIKEDAKNLAEMVIPFLIKEGIITEGQRLDIDWLTKAVSTLKERAKTLVELANSLKYYILDYVEIDPKAKEKFLKPENIRHLSELKELLSGVLDFTAAEIEKVFHAFVEKHGLKLGAIAQPVRVAITGGTASPGLFEVLEIVGKDKVLKRLSKAIEEG
ncbi:glutamate--tRNA ligase [Dissulfurispira thermophila]|uniref:glutamate--tRNA ligase n=1 Tax=hot springs metagenome TaxID=433727 RepID=A0A5J4L337_9ZZZZ|nr:glutamate--tRNA ligase [Dissulfurispira thermophila]